MLKRINRFNLRAAHALVLYYAILSPILGCAQPAPQPTTPTLPDLAHNSHEPLDLGQNRAAVLFFILADCPISNSYAPEINRIVADYTKQGVAVYIVHADRDMPDADLQQHAKEYGYTCPVLVDRKHELINRLGITVVPEVAVVSVSGVPGVHEGVTQGALAYRGRIDDRFPSLGHERLKPTTSDLRNALDALLRNEPISTPRTTATGCAITDN